MEERATTLAPRGGGLLAVHVRGLAEKRPSVLKGDILKVNRKDDKRCTTLFLPLLSPWALLPSHATPSAWLVSYTAYTTLHSATL